MVFKNIVIMFILFMLEPFSMERPHNGVQIDIFLIDLGYMQNIKLPVDNPLSVSCMTCLLIVSMSSSSLLEMTYVCRLYMP